MARRIERVMRKSALSADEARTAKHLRESIAGELDSIRSRAKQLLAEARAVKAVCAALRDARREQGFTLGDLERMTGIDRSALSKLERGERPNITFETLVRYAAALGKQLRIDLEDLGSAASRGA
jgi:DNA-binding Xre family transcriptional regulator